MSTVDNAIARAAGNARPRRRASAALGCLGILAFSFSFPATKLALEGFDPWLVAFGRAAVAGLPRRRLPRRRPRAAPDPRAGAAARRRRGGRDRRLPALHQPRAGHQRRRARRRGHRRPPRGDRARRRRCAPASDPARRSGSPPSRGSRVVLAFVLHEASGALTGADALPARRHRAVRARLRRGRRARARARRRPHDLLGARVIAAAHDSGNDRGDRAHRPGRARRRLARLRLRLRVLHVPRLLRLVRGPRARRRRPRRPDPAHPAAALRPVGGARPGRAPSARRCCSPAPACSRASSRPSGRELPSCPPVPAPFFIVGNDRSGTTMLRLILDAGPDVAIPPESMYLTDFAPVRAKGGPADARGRAGADPAGLGAPEGRALGAARRRARRAARRRPGDAGSASPWRRRSPPTRRSYGKPRLGGQDAALRPPRRLPALGLARARSVVVLVRDGRDVALSLKRHAVRPEQRLGGRAVVGARRPRRPQGGRARTRTACAACATRTSSRDPEGEVAVALRVPRAALRARDARPAQRVDRARIVPDQVAWFPTIFEGIGSDAVGALAARDVAARPAHVRRARRRRARPPTATSPARPSRSPSAGRAGCTARTSSCATSTSSACASFQERGRELRFALARPDPRPLPRLAVGGEEALPVDGVRARRAQVGGLVVDRLADRTTARGPPGAKRRLYSSSESARPPTPPPRCSVVKPCSWPQRASPSSASWLAPARRPASVFPPRW